MFNRNSVILSIFFAIVLFAHQVVALTVDPTRPSYYKTKISKKKLHLESILISERRKIAVINGSIVAEGDSINGSTVVTINKQKVRINSGGKMIDLVLPTATIRQEK